MNWKERHRSFYYKHAEQPNDISLQRCDTAHLIIDVQKTYLEEKPNSTENKEWQPFYERMNEIVIPSIKSFFHSLEIEELKISLLELLAEKKVELTDC